MSILCGAMAGMALGCASDADAPADVDARNTGPLASNVWGPEQELEDPEDATRSDAGPGQGAAARSAGFRHAQRLESLALSRGRYGHSLSVYRDLAAVGAPNAANPESAQVFVYERVGDVWTEQAMLSAPSSQAAGFGAAVAIHHDLLVVGAPQADTQSTDRAGAAYIYERSAAGWALRATLFPPSAEPWQGFGGQVALEHDRVVVGSVDRDYGALEDAGAAYVYEREGELFNLAAELYAPTPRAHDKFGHALATLDKRVVVSALGRDVGAHADAGAVYAFERGREGYGLAQVITAPRVQAGERFGTSLTLFYVAGLTQRLVVGAPEATFQDLTRAGAAYVFEAPERDTFTARETLFDPTPSADAGFGEHLSQTRELLLVGFRAKARAPKLLQFTPEGARMLSASGLPLPGGERCAQMTGPVALTGEHAFVGAWPAEVNSDADLSGAVQVFRKTGNALETKETLNE